MTACTIKLVIPPERVCFQHHCTKKSSWYLDSNCMYSNGKNVHGDSAVTTVALNFYL